MHTFFLSPAFTSLLLSTAVLAAFTISDGVNYVDIDWSLVRSQPNATGSITFAAPNVSQPFSEFTGQSLVDGWTMSIAVRAGNKLPTADTAHNITEIVATSISLAGPASLQDANGTVKADASWMTCSAIFSGPVPADFTNGSFADGDCTAALGADCVRDLTAAVDAHTDPYGLCSVRIPKSCEGAMSKSGFAASQTLNADYSGQEGIWQFAFRQIWEDSDDDEATQYGIAVRGVWPVLIQWQGNDSVQDGSGGVKVSTLHCVQADDVVPGHKIPSSAIRSGDVSAIMVVAVFALVFFV